MYGYIYETTNLINGKKYIGKRKSNKFDYSYKGSGVLLKKAFDKYGFENFDCKILEPIGQPTICDSLEDLNNAEKYYIKYYNAEKSDNYYNIASGGDGGDIFSKLSEESKMQCREKLSKSLKGKKQTESWVNKRKRCGKENGMFGKHLSEESKLKISKKVSGSGNGMYGVRSPMLGKKHSKESIEKMRNSKLGEKNPNWRKVYTEEEREEIRKKNSGDKNPRAIKCILICIDTGDRLCFGNIKEALLHIGVKQGMYYHYLYANKPVFSKKTKMNYRIDRI